MKNGERPIANPYVVLREEFDDWAILFNPDSSGRGFGLTPTGVCLWKLLDGEHPLDALLEEMRAHAEGVPEGASDHIEAFVDELVAEGLAGFGITGRGPEKGSYAPPGESSEVNTLNDESPLKAEGLAPTFTQRRFNVDQGPQPVEKKIPYEKPELIDFQADRRAHGAFGTACTNTGSSATATCSTGHLAAQNCTCGASTLPPTNCATGSYAFSTCGDGSSVGSSSCGTGA